MSAFRTLWGAVPVWEAGSAGAREAVVFVHGVPGSGRQWLPLLEAAGKLGRAVAFDLPGFGDATVPEGFDYTSGDYAEIIGLVLDELGVRTAHLVLHDFGGPWGLTWAARNPQRLGSATLINTGVWIDYGWNLLAAWYRTPVLGEVAMASVTYPLFAALMGFRAKRRIPEPALRAMWADVTPRTRQAALRVYRGMQEPAAEAEVLADQLCRLKRPGLVIWGATDWRLPLDVAERQRMAFPHADIHVLPESGHYPHLDDPETVASLVLPFWQEQLRSH